MKIGVITSSYPLNPEDNAAAAGLFVKDFAERLAQAGSQVWIITQSKEGRVEESPLLQVVRFPWKGDQRPVARLRPYHPRDAMKIYSLLKNGERALADAISDAGLQSLLAMWALPAGYLAYRAHGRFGIPYSVWALGSDIWKYERNPFVRPVLRGILHHAKKVYADGRELCRRVEGLTGRSCNFLPSARTLPLSDADEVRLDRSVPNFLFVGRYEHNKGADILLKAMKLLRDEKVEARLHMFGGGSLLPLLRGRIAEWGLERCVSVNGYIDLKRALGFMKECDFLVIPSRKESIPVIFSDAIQAAIPMLVTYTGDMGALVEKHKIGEAVPSGDPVLLKEGMKRMIRRGRGYYLKEFPHIRNLFSLENSVNTFLKEETFLTSEEQDE